MASKDYLRPEYKALSQMVYRDLKIACIVRGMEFNEVVEADHGILASFFIRNFYESQNPELLEDFDIWMDHQLEKGGIDKSDPLRDFKLSSVVDPKTQDVKLKRRKLGAGVKLPRKKPKRKEKNTTFNIRKGTKKEYTMELTKKLFELGKNMQSKKLQKKLTKTVRSKFPDANEKSIMIWYKKAYNAIIKEKT